jgi:hypothetical protein
VPSFNSSIQPFGLGDKNYLLGFSLPAIPNLRKVICMRNAILPGYKNVSASFTRNLLSVN